MTNEQQTWILRKPIIGKKYVKMFTFIIGVLCFTISPKKTPLREYGFDVDEYITKEGEGEMTVQLMEV